MHFIVYAKRHRMRVTAVKHTVEHHSKRLRNGWMTIRTTTTWYTQATRLWVVACPPCNFLWSRPGCREDAVWSISRGGTDTKWRWELATPPCKAELFASTKILYIFNLFWLCSPLCLHRYALCSGTAQLYLFTTSNTPYSPCPLQILCLHTIDKIITSFFMFITLSSMLPSKRLLWLLTQRNEIASSCC